MQYQLRTQVIEPTRPTFTALIKRYGGRPATRYEEGSVDIQPREHFHFRPLWGPEHEIYDVEYSAMRITDPDTFTDPRQFYYAPYVTSRAQLHDAFTRTLNYLTERDLLTRLPDAWQQVLGEMVLPLRHYESGAQLISVNGARFGYGSTITQCLAYAGFDRIGNAQMLSRVGIALGGNTDTKLAPAKAAWMDADYLQGLRRLTEELMVEADWAIAAFGLDLTDQLLYPLLTRHLDEAALLSGGGAYSLIAQHLATWYTDNRKWLDAILPAYLGDENHGANNAAILGVAASRLLPQAYQAITDLAKAIDNAFGASDIGIEAAVATTHNEISQRMAEAGIEVAA